MKQYMQSFAALRIVYVCAAHIVSGRNEDFVGTDLGERRAFHFWDANM